MLATWRIQGRAGCSHIRGRQSLFARNTLVQIPAKARHLVKVIVLDPLEAKTLRLNDRAHVAIEMASVAHHFLYRREAVLPPAHAFVICEAMLHEMQLTSRPQDPVQLAERLFDIGDAAQRPSADDTVKRLILARKTFSAHR